MTAVNCFADRSRGAVVVCFEVGIFGGISVAMAVAPTMTMQGSLAGLQQLELPRTSYLGSQLGSQFRVRQPCVKLSPRISSLKLHCQVSPSSTTLPQLNVDISGPSAVPLSYLVFTARLCVVLLPLWHGLCLELQELKPRIYMSYDATELAAPLVFRRAMLNMFCRSWQAIAACGANNYSLGSSQQRTYGGRHARSDEGLPAFSA